MKLKTILKREKLFDFLLEIFKQYIEKINIKILFKVYIIYIYVDIKKGKFKIFKERFASIGKRLR